MLCVLAVFIPSSSGRRGQGVVRAAGVGTAFPWSPHLSWPAAFVPVVAVRDHRAHRQDEIETANPPLGRQRRDLFTRTLWKKVVAARWLVTAVYLVAAVALILLVGGRLGTEIFPKVDAGQLQLRLRAPSGTRVETTEAIALEVLKLIENEVGKENVALTLGFVGVHAPTYPINLVYHWNGGSEEGVVQVQLKRGTPVRIDELKERLREKLSVAMPDVSFSFEPSDIVSRVMILGSPTPIEVAVSGPSLAANHAFAEKSRAQLEKIPALRDIQYGQSLDYRRWKWP